MGLFSPGGLASAFLDADSFALWLSGFDGEPADVVHQILPLRLLADVVLELTHEFVFFELETFLFELFS